MPPFSQRIGARPVLHSIQLDGMDDPLHNSLWNEILTRFGGQQSHWSRAARFLARDLFKVAIDRVPDTEEDAQSWVRHRFFTSAWHEAYDILEFLVRTVDDICNPAMQYNPYYTSQHLPFTMALNVILERELSGYRFIQGLLAPVSDPAEVLAIEAASVATSKSGLSGAHEHIRAALALLGQKPSPDYRNSIKESISAVEATVNAIAGTDGNGVAGALEALSRKVEIHGALRSALKQLYGYTSDAGGIRHGILDQTTVGYDEAKFMLVSCSAFVNFVVAKSIQAGLFD